MAHKEFNQINYFKQRTYEGFEVIFLDGKKLVCQKFNKGQYRFTLIENNHEYLLPNSCLLDAAEEIFGSVAGYYKMSFEK